LKKILEYFDFIDASMIFSMIVFLSDHYLMYSLDQEAKT